MAQVIIRNLDAATVEALRARARANGRSLEAELRLLLQTEAAKGWTVYEGAPGYGIEPRPAEGATGSGLTLPKKSRKFRDFTPIKIKGRPASEILIEERR